jgi:hypothetical protein
VSHSDIAPQCHCAIANVAKPATAARPAAAWLLLLLLLLSLLLLFAVKVGVLLPYNHEALIG